MHSKITKLLPKLYIKSKLCIFTCQRRTKDWCRIRQSTNVLLSTRVPKFFIKALYILPISLGQKIPSTKHFSYRIDFLCSSNSFVKMQIEWIWLRTFWKSWNTNLISLFSKSNEVRLGQFAISIIQISLIPFRLSKLRNLIGTERVWQNCLFGSVLESLWNLFQNLQEIQLGHLGMHKKIK